MRLPVITAVVDARWEAGLVSAFEQAEHNITVVRRCVDLADLLATAATGTARAALLSADLRRLDRDALLRLGRPPHRGRRARAAGRRGRRPSAAPARRPVRPAGRRGGERHLRRGRRGGRRARRCGGAGRGGRPDGHAAARAAPARRRRRPSWSPAPAGSSRSGGRPAPPAVRRWRSRWPARSPPPASRRCSSTPTSTAAWSPSCSACSRRRPASRPPPAWPTTAASTSPRCPACAARSAPSLRVLTGITRADRWPELRGGALEVVLALARTIAAVVVVDLGFCLEQDEELSYDTTAPRRNGATLTVLEQADTVVAVAAADPVGLQRFVRGYGDLREVLAGVEPVVVVNKVRPARGAGRPGRRDRRRADPLRRRRPHLPRARTTAAASTPRWPTGAASPSRPSGSPARKAIAGAGRRPRRHRRPQRRSGCPATAGGVAPYGEPGAAVWPDGSQVTFAPCPTSLFLTSP